MPAKTPQQEQADRILAAALDEVAEAYGVPAVTSEEWCIAWGGEDANDCAGRLEYDDEAEAGEMRQWIDGGIVARQMVIRLPWQTVPAEGESEPQP